MCDQSQKSSRNISLLKEMEKVYFYLLFTGVCIVKCTITIDEEPKGNLES